MSVCYSRAEILRLRLGMTGVGVAQTDRNAGRSL